MPLAARLQQQEAFPAVAAALTEFAHNQTAAESVDAVSEVLFPALAGLSPTYAAAVEAGVCRRPCGVAELTNAYAAESAGRLALAWLWLGRAREGLVCVCACVCARACVCVCAAKNTSRIPFLVT